MSDSLKEVDKNAQDALNEIDDWFNTLVPSSVEKSTKKEPIKYKKEKKNISSKVVAVGVAVAIAIGGIAYGMHQAKSNIDTNMFNHQIESYIDETYDDLVETYRTYDNKYYFYKHDEIAKKIAQSEDMDEAIYAAWFKMTANKEDNMNDVMLSLSNILPDEKKESISPSFVSYVRNLGYIDDEGYVDYENYSASMKDSIAKKAGIESIGMGK